MDRTGAPTECDRRSPGFRVLGPVEAVIDGLSVRLTPKCRCLLAALLVNAGRPVRAERLIGYLWDGDEKPSRTALHIHVTRLRKAISSRHHPDRLIRTVSDGYLADLPGADALDLNRFDAAVRAAASARRAGDAAVETRLLTEAMSCWRGAALSDVPSPGLHREVVPALTERWLQTADRRCELAVFSGAPQQVLPELRMLVAEHPGRERFRYLLMLALFRNDQRGNALREFRMARQWLNDNLGIDPGRRLARLHNAILTGDEADLAAAEGRIG